MDLSPPPALGDRVNTVEPLTYSRGNTATGGVWRVHGPAGRAILKVARPPAGRADAGADDPAHWNYWKREALAYRTGLVRRVYADSGIVVPDLLRVEDRPDGTIALWLSEATGTGGAAWPLERLAAFARQLGEAQARWVGRKLHWPWLSRRWLAGYLAARTVPAEVPWDQPAGAAAWPEPLRRAARALLADRDALVACAERSPRTFCHLDVWPMNLVEDGARTVLLDWAFAGEGALGEDVANLVVDTVRFGLVDVALLPDVARECTDGYLAGLRAGGWTGPESVVRRAVAASGAAKFSWLAPAMLLSAARGERLTHPAYGRDEPPEETFLRRRPILELLISWYESVR